MTKRNSNDYTSVLYLPCINTLLNQTIFCVPGFSYSVLLFVFILSCISYWAFSEFFVFPLSRKPIFKGCYPMEFPLWFFSYPVEIPQFFVLTPWNFMLLCVNPMEFLTFQYPVKMLLFSI